MIEWQQTTLISISVHDVSVNRHRRKPPENSLQDPGTFQITYRVTIARDDSATSMRQCNN